MSDDPYLEECVEFVNDIYKLVVDRSLELPSSHIIGSLITAAMMLIVKSYPDNAVEFYDLNVVKSREAMIKVLNKRKK